MRSRPAPPPPTAADRREATRSRRRRALEETLEVTPRAIDPFLELEVRNLERRSRYEVLWPGGPTDRTVFCSCEDFARRGLGTCKHVEAARLWLSEQPNDGRPPRAPFDGQELWKAIDRALEALPTGPIRDPRSLRGPGRALLAPVQGEPA